MPITYYTGPGATYWPTATGSATINMTDWAWAGNSTAATAAVWQDMSAWTVIQTVQREVEHWDPEGWAAAQARVVERNEALRQADEKAKTLLLSILTVAQRRELETHQRVTVKARSGRVYRLFCHVSGNIAIMDGETRRATLCVHPGGRLPVLDVVAGQVLAIRHNEREFLRRANLHAGSWSEDELAIRRGGLEVVAA